MLFFQQPILFSYVLPYPPSLKSYLNQIPIFPHPKSHPSCVFSSLFLVFPDGSLLVACFSPISSKRNFISLSLLFRFWTRVLATLAYRGCVGNEVLNQLTYCQLFGFSAILLEAKGRMQLMLSHINPFLSPSCLPNKPIRCFFFLPFLLGQVVGFEWNCQGWVRVGYCGFVQDSRPLAYI